MESRIRGETSFFLPALFVGLLALVISGQAFANVWVKKDEVPPGGAEPRVIVEFYNPDAPDIVVESPEVSEDTVPTPVKVDIRFVPREGTAIDPESVRLLYVTFFTNIDITDRVRDRISAKGIRDDNAELPSGSHHLIVKVSDDRGQEKTKEFRFNVE